MAGSDFPRGQALLKENMAALVRLITFYPRQKQSE